VVLDLSQQQAQQYRNDNGIHLDKNMCLAVCLRAQPLIVIRRNPEYGVYPTPRIFLFIFLLRRGYDWSEWMNNFFDWFNNLFNPEKKKKRKSPKDEFFYNVSGTQPYKKIPHITQKRIDDILDKINQQGYRFLTNEETITKRLYRAREKIREEKISLVCE